MMFSKSIVALLIGVVGSALPAFKKALEDGKVNYSDLIGIATAVITALGVYIVPNK